MKVLKPGHKYELQNYDHPEKPGQVIQFIEKVPAVPPPSNLRVRPPLDVITTGELVTVNDGTTNEELILVLVDRLRHLNSKFPSRENAVAITHIETGLLWLRYRTENREARGVEGKALV